MRNSEIKRATKETDVTLTLELDGTGKSVVDTGCGFLNHMLTLFAAHGRFDLNVMCRGDYDVDYHHTTEDVGICLGLAFREALGDKRGITRYGNMILPMDEALVMTAVDFSGRAFMGWVVGWKMAGPFVIPTNGLGLWSALRLSLCSDCGKFTF